MATDKLFSVAGVSTQSGKTKVRFANDTMRIKILAKNGHTGIELVDLPRSMTKGEIAQYMTTSGFMKDNKDVQAAIAYIAKKNPVEGSKATAATAEAVAA